MTVCDFTIHVSDTVENLGVYLDKELKMSDQINYVCKVTFPELRRINSNRHPLDTAATKKPVIYLVLSRPDYSSSLLAGLPLYVIKRLRHVQNAARLILRAPRFEHTSTLLQQLHWLPIPARILDKHSCLPFSAINLDAPSYLPDVLRLHRPSRSVRSSVSLTGAATSIICLSRQTRTHKTRILSRQKYACHNKIFLSRQNVCRHKHVQK